MAKSQDTTIVTGSTFRFRRYRDEAALRCRRKVDGSLLSLEDESCRVFEGDIETDTSTVGHTKMAKSTKETSCNEEEDGGTVIQDLSGAVVIIDADGIVTIDEESDINKEKDYETREYKSKRRQPVSEGTTLMFLNLQDCCVTM